MEREPRPWSYGSVVRAYLRPTDRVLDVGTGGGERFVTLADAYATGVGVDHDPEMVNTARRKLPAELCDRIEFHVMDADRQGLTPGGYFIGQEV